MCKIGQFCDRTPKISTCKPCKSCKNDFNRSNPRGETCPHDFTHCGDCLQGFIEVKKGLCLNLFKACSKCNNNKTVLDTTNSTTPEVKNDLKILTGNICDEIRAKCSLLVNENRAPEKSWRIYIAVILPTFVFMIIGFFFYKKKIRIWIFKERGKDSESAKSEEEKETSKTENTGVVKFIRQKSVEKIKEIAKPHEEEEPLNQASNE